MEIGVSIRLYDGATAQSSITGITALWWDMTEVVDFKSPAGRTAVALTDADGDLELDLSNVSGLTVGDWGYLLLYKEDGTDHEDSPMFAGQVQTTTVSSGTVLGYVSSWVRPSDWLTLPTVTDTENKMVALFAVYKGGPNWCTFRFTTADASAYTVDWGDGSSPESVNSNTTSEHSFSYDDLDGDTETNIDAARAVTFQDSGDTVTLAGHGFTDGVEIVFSSITTTTGLTLYTRYYVRDISGATFKVATTPGGTAIALTNDGSGSVYLPGYRQAIITVTVGSGKSIATVSFNYRHSSASATIYAPKFLDITLSAPSATSVVVSTSSQSVRLRNLQQFSVLSLGTMTNFSNMFTNCSSLQSVPLFNTASGTDFTSMFESCSSLQSVPLFNIAAGTNFSSMFYGCSSLQSVPLFNTAAGTNFSSMFRGCKPLPSIPLLNTAAGTNFSYMFNDCYSLQSVPLLNTAAGTNFSYMFRYCHSLASVPLLNTAAVITAFTYMFDSCPSLQVGRLEGTKLDISYASCQLSATQLDAIYTGLASGVTSKTITVTGNYGVASDTPTIATDKGWTVTS